jgi:exopolysaccharide biosynthesis glucosyltransferase PssS
LLAREGDDSGLGDRLATLLTDRDLWSRLSRRSMALARERFDLRRQTALLEDHYDRILGRPH